MANELSRVQQNYAALADTLRDRGREIAQLLPGTHGDAKAKSEAVAKFCRQMMTACERNPALLEADQGSLFLAGLNIAATGLDPSGNNGEAALVPYAGKVTPIIMARGLVILAVRSGAARAIEHNVVCEGDSFDWELGTAAYIRHKPSLGKRGAPVAVWAIATLPSGEKVYEVMGWPEVEAIKARSKSGAKGGGPWGTDPLEMGRKTVLRRLSKRLPYTADDSGIAAMLQIQAAEDANFGIDTTPRADLPQVVRSSGGGMAALRAATSDKAKPVETTPAKATDPAEVCPVCGRHQPDLRGQMDARSGCPECGGRK